MPPESSSQRAVSRLGFVVVFVQLVLLLLGPTRLLLVDSSLAVAAHTAAGNTTVTIAAPAPARRQLQQAELSPGVRSSALCLMTDGADRMDPNADNECTEVMRYAACPEQGCIDFGTSIEETEALHPECRSCAEGSPYPTWQEMALSGAQELCMRASRYGCTYTIQGEMLPPPPPPPPPTQPRTCGAVQCEPPLVAKAGVADLWADSVSDCCECSSHGERDVTNAYCVSKDDPDPGSDHKCTRYAQHSTHRTDPTLACT